VKKRVRIKGLDESLCDAEVLLIVPPFAKLQYPSLAVHLLQACGRQSGFRVHVLYANILLASLIGEEAYALICDAPWGSFAAERFFARCAFNLPPLGRYARRMFETPWVIYADEGAAGEVDFGGEKGVRFPQLQRLEKVAADRYVEAVAHAVSQRHYKIVGCTTQFDQTTASVALLNRIKRFNQGTTTILGGANCEGEMARGIASLGANIDYIFSGESETTFPWFVRTVLTCSPPKKKIIQGRLRTDLDALPTPMFTEYYVQRNRHLPRSRTREDETEILYETSRGCWWGQKQHCTFCGLNDEGMAFRQKSPDRVLEELRILLNAHPTKKIFMTDDIMPYSYFQTLLPRLDRQFPDVSIFYEQKANLSLQKIVALQRARITSIQPGIEALSSRLLRLMRKGVLARQNLMLLRYVRAAGIEIEWNLLWGFPGDEVEAYEETLALVPLLHHLPPPTEMTHLSLDRFSPYLAEPEKFGLCNVSPLAGYYDFLPKNADVQRIAYHFTAEYKSGAHDNIDVISKLWQATERWQATWKKKNREPLEDLRLSRNRGSYVLVDTRKVAGRERVHRLDESRAYSLISSKPYSGNKLEAWALTEKLAVIADGWFVPLVLTEPEILLEAMEGAGKVSEAPDSPLRIIGESHEPETKSLPSREGPSRRRARGC
jgi:ribosomal peptide maturation radical SAM protein 1